ncbi:cyclin-like protein interacting with PHO85 [Coemansia sp. BCRC 34962]|nr:cyclin-like protein interacting with PHO85 [Coemansia sp. BCRC 34962]
MFDIVHTPISVTVARMAELIDSVTSANHRYLGPIINDITPFHSRAVPAISVHDYLERMAKFVGLENDSLIAVLVYLDRITRAQIHRPAFAPSPFNIHRLLITAIVVAHKFNSDIFFNNARYSKVGGIPLAELNQLELELLFMARFDLKIDAPEIQRIGEWLVAPRTRANFYQHLQHPECVLSTYHADVALAHQAELCKLEYPTPAMDPMTAGSSSAVVPPLDLSAPYSASPAHSALLSRNASGHHYAPPLPMVQSGVSVELTTPASLPTLCPPATPPPCRWCRSYEIDGRGVMIGQFDRVSHVCPHVGSLPGHHVTASSFDSGVSCTDNSAYAPGNAVLDAALTQKRRRMPAMGAHPALAAPSAGIAIAADGSASAMAPHAVNVGGGTDDD